MLAEALDDKKGMGAAYTHFGLYHFQKGDRDKALESYQLALEVFGDNNYPIFALADQDDVWRQDKLFIVSDKLNETSQPHLIFSDLQVTDADLNTTSPSFYASTRLIPDDPASLQRLLMENYIPGCSMAGNRALLEKILPYPGEIFNHDWWVAVNATLFGEVHYVPDSLISYRQHADNVTGSDKGLSDYLPGHTMARKLKRQVRQVKQQSKILQSLLDKLSGFFTDFQSCRPVARVSFFVRL